MVSSNTAAELVLAGALGASLIAAIASVVSGILSRRHDRDVRLNDKRLAAFTEVISASNLYRSRAVAIVRASARESSTGASIREDEIAAYLNASWGLGAAAQSAEIFTTNTNLDEPLQALEDAFGEVSHWTSQDTQDTVRFTGKHEQLAESFAGAIVLFDEAHLDFVAAAQRRLKIK